MQWIALAAVAWGVVLGLTEGPAAGATAAVGGLAAVALLALLSAALRRGRRTRGRTRRRRVASTTGGTPWALTSTDLPSAADADRRLLELYWNFRRVEDVALLAECGAPHAQARLIELLLSPTGAPVQPVRERLVTQADRDRAVQEFAAGSGLTQIAAASGLSEWTIGRILLEHAPEPIGLVAER